MLNTARDRAMNPEYRPHQAVCKSIGADNRSDFSSLYRASVERVLASNSQENEVFMNSKHLLSSIAIKACYELDLIKHYGLDLVKALISASGY